MKRISKLVALSVCLFILFLSSMVVAQSGEATVTQNPLNFRDVPSTKGQVLQRLTFESHYPVLAQTASGFWFKLNVDGTEGWVCSHLVTIDVDVSTVAHDTTVVDEDCKGNAISSDPSIRTYRKVRHVEENGSVNYAIVDATTEEILFITSSQYPGSVNDVKAGAFSDDHTKFAAAYHYSPDMTWIGVWSVPDGAFLYSKVKTGFSYYVKDVFD